MNGQINLLTTTSFDRPQDLFDATAGAPRPIAYVSLVAPLPTGDWAVRGSMTRGRHLVVDSRRLVHAQSHAVDRTATRSGLSYATQRYQGGNVDALAAMRDGSRNVGEIYVPRQLDDRTAAHARRLGAVTPVTTISPIVLCSADVSVVGLSGRCPTIRCGSASPRLHREMAPGAEEFVAPVERPLAAAGAHVLVVCHVPAELRPEKVDVVEISGERPVGGDVVVAVRAFRQQVDDQLVTLFGATRPDGAPVARSLSGGVAGDFENYGWGVTVARHVLPAT